MAKNRSFREAARMNTQTYRMYLDRLTELAISMFEWTGLPDTVDSRFMELILFNHGAAVYFDDETIGNLCLKVLFTGPFNVYHIPTKRHAYAVNGYYKNVTERDSVIVWNNMLHENSFTAIDMFAKRLANLDRIIDVNANTQKTPVMVECDEKERLTMENTVMQWDGNYPIIYGRKGITQNTPLKVLKTDCQFIGKEIYELKTLIWNEAMTYLGISNVNTIKKERMVSDEVLRNLGGTVASRYSRLQARQKACEEINKMFNTDIWCEYREDGANPELSLTTQTEVE